MYLACKMTMARLQNRGHMIPAYEGEACHFEQPASNGAGRGNNMPEASGAANRSPVRLTNESNSDLGAVFLANFWLLGVGIGVMQ